jgi:putative effector of murein hydrolase
MIDLHNSYIGNPIVVHSFEQYRVFEDKYNWPIIIPIALIAMVIEILYVYWSLKWFEDKRKLLVTLFTINIITIPIANLIALQYGYYAELLPFCVEWIILCVALRIRGKSLIARVIWASLKGNVISMITAALAFYFLSKYGIYMMNSVEIF